jgi:hypothetical protein
MQLIFWLLKEQVFAAALFFFFYRFLSVWVRYSFLHRNLGFGKDCFCVLGYFLSELVVGELFFSPRGHVEVYA